MSHFASNAEAARLMASEPLGPLPPSIDTAPAAAWTVVAGVILNLDGVLSKR